MTLRIGLTGGIGSGKSTVARLFANKGIPIIDADVIARKLVEPGEPALAEIARSLGNEFVSGDGQLHRTRLREAIFENESKRLRLEAILHPRVAKIVEEEVASLDSPYSIIVIPLLFEAAQEHLVDRVLVVDTTEESQVERVITRDHIDEEKVKQIMASQLDRKSRLSRADEVIMNDGDKSGLEYQVNRLHECYLQMAR